MPTGNAADRVKTGRVRIRSWSLDLWGPWRAGDALLAACGFAFALAMILLFWVGYTESDDLAYADAARGWLLHAPYLAHSHWGLRHVVVLPMALAFALGGETEATLLLPSLLYGLALLILVYVIARHVAGPLAAALAVAVAGGVPVIATGVSLVSTDLPEAVFVLASLWTFHLTCERAPAAPVGNDRRQESGRQASGHQASPRQASRRHASRFVLAGVLAGLAFLTRETAVTLLLLYGLLFLTGYGGRRTAFLWLGAGFAAIVLADWTYTTALSGDPLFRQHISLKGVAGDGPQMAGAFATAPGVDQFGSLAVPRWAKPLAVLFLNQNFGLFFPLAVPAAAWLAWRPPPDAARRLTRLFGLMAAAWVVVLGYVLMPWLWVIPRYFAASAAALAIPFAVLMARWLTGRARAWAVALLLLLLGSDLALAAAAGRPFFGERSLVTFARETTEPLWTDPATERGAHWLLATQGLDGRVHVGAPPAGGLYVLNPHPRRAEPAGVTSVVPDARWTLLREIVAPRKWTSVLAALPYATRLLPAGILAKLAPPPEIVRLYRAPE